MSFIVKDSGQRQPYKSGMVRDTQEGKPDYTLIELSFLTRIAEHLGKGLEKYGRDNWKLANSEEELTRFKSSAMRHLIQWLSGDVDEDHAAAVVFNLMASEYVKSKLDRKDEKIVHPDLPNYRAVRIKKAPTGSWYATCVGDVFEVYPEKEEVFYWRVSDFHSQRGSLILDTDAEEVPYVSP